ncbi:MAG TPA: hypothetical protein VNN73_06220 [Blastocatellia bacterium]|nr:hypothetical protein [Blastocatellia bacterium]
MSRLRVLSLIFMALAVSLPTFAAQRPAQPAPPANGPTRNTYGESAPGTPGTDYYEMTRSFSGKITEIRADEQWLSVKDDKGRVLQFFLDKKTRLKADKKTELAEKKEITLDDFHTGQNVKVTFWPSNLKATEVRLRAREKD